MIKERSYTSTLNVSSVKQNKNIINVFKYSWIYCYFPIKKIEIKMDEIVNVTISPLTGSSNFVEPYRMTYTQSGKTKNWDLVFQKASVSVIIYNSVKRKLILVKQFRPAVYASAFKRSSTLTDINNAKRIDSKEGITLELCAGIIDKPNKTPKEIAQLEVMEECGYDIPLEKLEHVMTFLSGVGISGENMHLFYAEVTDEMCVSTGGGLECEGEMIDVVEMTLNEVESYLNQKIIKSPMFTVFGLTWFLTNKRTQESSSIDISNVIVVSLIGVLSFFAGIILSAN